MPAQKRAASAGRVGQQPFGGRRFAKRARAIRARSGGASMRTISDSTGKTNTKKSKKFAKRARKAVSVFGVMTPSHFNAFLHKQPLPVPYVMAPGSFVESSKVYQTNVATGASYRILLTFTATDILFYVMTNTSIFEMKSDILTTSQALEIRGGRLSAKISNLTKSQDVGGEIKVLTMQNPLNLQFVNGGTIHADTKTLLDNLLADDSRVKKIPAGQLAVQPYTCSTHPIKALDFAGYNTFSPMQAGGEQLAYNLGVLNGGCSQVLIELGGSSVTQTYSVQVLRHDYLRFQEGSLLANAGHRAPPRVNHDQFAGAAVQAYQAQANAPMFG